MTDPDYHDPSMEYPPTRPTLRMMLAAATVVLVAVVFLNWSHVSAFAHINAIEHEIANVTGL